MNLNLLKYIGIGGSLAFAAAVQPGPLMAYLLSRSTTLGWKRTLPACLAPIVSDGPIVVLTLLVIGHLSMTMQSVLRTAGGLLLLYLARNALIRWRRGEQADPKEGGKVPRTLLEAALVNLLNPSPYLGWTLVVGPTVISAWREAPGLGVAVVAAFYVTIVSMLALLILLFGSARLLGPKFLRILMLISVVILAGLGVYQLMAGFQYLKGL